MAKQHTEAVQHSSVSPDWRTPPALYATLDAEFCFVLDAAATAQDKLCPHYFGPDHVNPKLRNALDVDWAAFVRGCYDITGALSRSAIWINPPYSRKLSLPITPWLEKCWQEAQRGCTIVGVIPYSPQTEWWRTYVEGQQEEGATLKMFFAAREVRKIPHRVTFLRPNGEVEGNAGGNTAIVVWRPKHGVCAPWVPWSPYFEYL